MTRKEQYPFDYVAPIWASEDSVVLAFRKLENPFPSPLRRVVRYQPFVVYYFCISNRLYTFVCVYFKRQSLDGWLYYSEEQRFTASTETIATVVYPETTEHQLVPTAGRYSGTARFCVEWQAAMRLAALRAYKNCVMQCGAPAARYFLSKTQQNKTLKNIWSKFAVPIYEDLCTKSI